MSKIFILPKAEEIGSEKSNGDQDVIQRGNVYLLFPQNIITGTRGCPLKGNDVCNEDETAKKIVSKIELLSEGDQDLYLLYHIGNAVSLDEELKEIVPHLHTQMYSHTFEKQYGKIKALIRSIIDDESAQNTEALIAAFFFDKEQEAKIALLQACLTPEEAQGALPIDMSDWPLKAIVIKYTEKGREYTQNIREYVLHRLAGKQDCFSEDYIINLTSLRIALQ